MTQHIKPLFLLFLFATSASLFAQEEPQFANPGFENWTTRDIEAVSEPVNWHSGGTATGTFSGFLSSQIEQSNHSRPSSPGTKCVRLYPSSVLGVTANGNLTNGRMNAGSMSATGSNNYNYTQRSNNAFNTPIDRVPDSIAIWVCFRCQSTTQKAQLHAAVHGDADYRFIANGSEEPLNMLVASARYTFTRTSPAGGDYNWRRISVPFVKDGSCNDPRYILFTITTNEVPGEGSTDDDLFVDDIELIYNPDQLEESLTICNLFPNPCSDQLNIKAEKAIVTVKIIDLFGCTRLINEAHATSTTISLGHLPSGIYCIQLDFGDKKSVKRIIKL